MFVLVLIGQKLLMRFWNIKLIIIIKINETLAGNKIKNEIEQLLLKYKHGNNIHEHRKQQSEQTTQIYS